MKPVDAKRPGDGTDRGGQTGERAQNADRTSGEWGTMTVKLILDFDGVLQADYADDEWSDTRTALVSFIDDAGDPDAGYLIRWSPTLIRELDALRREYDLTLFYLTTWLRPGNALECFLDTVGGLAGGTRLRMPARDEDQYRPERWKIDEVHRLNTEIAGPVIWADDLEVRVFGHEVAESELGFPSLTIGPHTAFGLTPVHLGQIRAFCESLR